MSLIPIRDGFEHTQWWDPDECEPLPLRAVVYVVPRRTTNGSIYSEQNQPEITFVTTAS